MSNTALPIRQTSVQMGKMQRNKGTRLERELTNDLKDKGWDAQRIPGSGAFAYRVKNENLKGDIRVRIDGRIDPLKIECKGRKTGLDKIYALFEILRFQDVDGVITKTNLVQLTDIFGKTVNRGNMSYIHAVRLPDGFDRTLNKLDTIHQWLDGADVLAIKQDRKPWLFLTFESFAH